MAEQQDPEVPDVPEHDLSEEDMMFVSLLYNYILALEAEEREEEQQRQGEVDLPAGGRRPFIRSCWWQSVGILGERERAWGSLPSVTKPLYSWESMRVLRQSVTKRVRAWWKRLTSCQIFKPDRNKSWDILTKRVKWWQTMKTWVPALNQALLSFPTHWVKLCWDLLRFVKLWYALGALINSWQSVQNF